MHDWGISFFLKIHRAQSEKLPSGHSNTRNSPATAEVAATTVTTAHKGENFVGRNNHATKPLPNPPSVTPPDTDDSAGVSVNIININSEPKALVSLVGEVKVVLVRMAD